MPKNKKLILNEKHKRFCLELLKDLDRVRAYKVIYPDVKNDKVARANANRLLLNATILEYLEECYRKINEKALIKDEEILTELKNIAVDRDITEYLEYDRKGVRVISSKNLTSMQRKALSEASESRDKDGNIFIKLKTHDKLKALELLGKYKKLFSDTINVDNSIKKITSIQIVVNRTEKPQYIIDEERKERGG